MDNKDTQTIVPTSTVTPTPIPVQPTAQEQKKGNQTLLIVVVVILVLCCACSSIAAGVFYFSQNAIQEATIQLDNARKIQEEKTKGDNISNGKDYEDDSDFNFSEELPSDFPKDIPIFSNAEASGTSSTGAETSVIFSAKATPTDIVTYYETNLPKNGWTIKSSLNFLVQSITATKGNRELQVTIIGDEAQSDSILTLTY